MQAATLEVLESADVPPRQARAIAQAIEIEIAAGRGELASRHDIALVRQEIALLRTEIKAEFKAELKAEVAGLRGEMERQIGGLHGEMDRQSGGLRSEVEQQIGGLRSEVDRQIVDLRSELRAGLANIKTLVAEAKADNVRWIFLCILGQTAVLLGAGYFFVSQLLV